MDERTSRIRYVHSVEKTAILVDGGFYRKRAYTLCGDKPARERANELEAYCQKHISKMKDASLYRVFYYDCPPLDKNVYHPLTKKQINYKKGALYLWTTEFFSELLHRRKFALRMGKLEERNSTSFRLKDDVLKKLLAGTKALNELREDDFILDYGQKGVDMRIGLDISSLAHKHLVSRIILISGDSDFVPAAKYARREGIDFILDSMGQKVNNDLYEHIDGMRSNWKWLINGEDATTDAELTIGEFGMDLE